MFCAITLVRAACVQLLTVMCASFARRDLHKRHAQDPTNHCQRQRKLSMLLRILNVAQREGWILRSPFAAGDSLISLADENKRERISRAKRSLSCSRHAKLHNERTSRRS